MEARVGIEPTHKGFADLSLTTWVPRPLLEQKLSVLFHCTGNCLRASTADDLRQSWAKNLADFVCHSSIIPTECVIIPEGGLSFLVTEAVLTFTHRSIQSIHDCCIAMAERVQPRTGYPETFKDRV